MYKIVDQVMLSARDASPLSETELRKRVFAYLELLFSTGLRDPEELVALGVEYLRETLKGPDPRFTGC